MKIYIGNLPYSTTEPELMTLFSEYGKVYDLSLAKDKYTGESKGFAFVEIKRSANANKAISALNGSYFQGRNINVNQAQTKRKDTGWYPGM